MFDWLPFQAWLLLLFGVWAYVPAQFIYRYITSSPSRLEVGYESGDADWRTPGRLALNITALLVILSLAVFIFTPDATEFARSPQFLPLLMSALAVFLVYSTIKGVITGEVEPLIKGGFGPYRQLEHPRRYWASVAWNVVFTCLFVFLIFKI